MWYFKDTEEVFHIGKGTGNRYKETKNSRNNFFKNIVNAYSDNVDVKIYKDGLTEQEAWDLEKTLIAQYKAIGQCKTNFHEGGRGGYTGNYNNPERSRKISEALKGKAFTEEHRANLAKANREREKTQEEIDRITNLNKGKKMDEKTYVKMMNSLCPFEYQVFLNNQHVFSCLGTTELFKYCKDQYNIPSTIVNKVLAGTWKPTFNKHKHLATLKILKIERCIDQRR